MNQSDNGNGAWTVVAGEPAGGEVRLLFAGDFFGGNRTGALCREGNYGDLFNDLVPVLRDKDLSVVNLESPLTTVEDPIPKNGPHLKAHPCCGDALRFAGFDIVSLANNHIMDHGERGLHETLEVCGRLGLRTVGAGRNLDEAGRPLLLDVKGLRIAILNMAEDEFSIAGEDFPGANPLDPVRNYYQVQAARRLADVVIAVVHGGNEMYPHPSPRMVETCHYLADIGACAVVGHHPHCAAGYEVYRNVPVFYSIGNFIFDADGVEDGSWNLGYVVTISVGAGGVSGFRLHPYRQSARDPGVRLLRGTEREGFMQTLRDNSFAIVDHAKLKYLWSDFCRSRELFYLKHLMGLGRIDVALLRREIGTRAILREKKLVEMLNYVRCPAHRDVAVESLKRTIESRRNGR